MKAGIVVFPGINRERDMAIALQASAGVAPRIFHSGIANAEKNAINEYDHSGSR